MSPGKAMDFGKINYKQNFKSSSAGEFKKFSDH